MTRFSTTSTTPSLDLTPIAVVPSCEGKATRTPSLSPYKEQLGKALYSIGESRIIERSLLLNTSHVRRQSPHGVQATISTGHQATAHPSRTLIASMAYST